MLDYAGSANWYVVLTDSGDACFMGSAARAAIKISLSHHEISANIELAAEVVPMVSIIGIS